MKNEGRRESWSMELLQTPRRLIVQLSALFACLTAVSILVFTLYTVDAEVARVESHMKRQAEVLGTSVAATAGDHLLTRDYTAVEKLILRSVRFPGVVKIQICDPLGDLIGDVSQEEGAEPQVTYGADGLTTPEKPESTTALLDDRMVVWEPVMLGHLLGWVRIEYSLAAIREAESRIWAQNIRYAVAVTLVSIVLLVLLLRAPVRWIGRYTEFANRLNDDFGKQVPLSRVSIEIERLGRAMNLASIRLARQNAAVESSVGDLERLAAFPENDPGIVVSMDLHGRVSYANPVTRRTLQEMGLEPHEIGTLLPTTLSSIIAELVERGGVSRENEVHSGDRVFLWNFSILPVQEIIHGFASDITDRRRAEGEAREALLEKSMAEAANEAKSSFLAIMSHEIRTPLTAIIGYSESLLEGSLGPESRNESLQSIARNGEHLLDVINNILDLSKIEAGRIDVESLDVSPFDIVNDVKAISILMAESKGLRFEIDHVFPLPGRIITDPVRLKQILLNLSSNAIKFTSSGSVTIRLCCDEESEQIRFDVIDTGIGLSANQVDRIFEAFAQGDSSTSRRYGGTGLGLHLSRRLAGLLSGSLTVESEKGTGSTFTLTVATGPLEQVAWVRSREELPERRLGGGLPAGDSLGGRILLADDNTDNRHLISIVLRHMGATVELAEDGQGAIDKAMKNPFDLILMDMRMPGVDGIEATRTLRELGYTGPIVALTANATREDRDRCAEAGSDGFLTKPIVRSEFVPVVSSYLTKKSDPSRSDAVRPVHEPEDPILSSLDCDDPEMTELIEAFVEDLPQRVAELRDAYERRDHAALAHVAHNLKGVGGSFGYWIITELAADLEDALREGDDSRTVDLVEELVSTARRIRAGSVPGEAIVGSGDELGSPGAGVPDLPVDPPGPRLRVLFVCTRIGLRAQLAEQTLRGLAGGSVAVSSAGFERADAPQSVVREAARLGIEIDCDAPKTVFDQYRSAERFTHIVTLCDEMGVEECRPLLDIVSSLFGRDAQVVSWDVPHPGSEIFGDLGMPKRVELVVERIRFLVDELLRDETIRAA